MHPLTGAWRLAWTQVNLVKSGARAGVPVNLSSLSMGMLPGRMGTASNVRQTIDVERGLWIDTVTIETEEFVGSWTVRGNLEYIISPVPPFPVKVAYYDGYLTQHRGGVPSWLEAYVARDYDLRAKHGALTTLSISPTSRIDRDEHGRMAMLTRISSADVFHDADLFHDVPPAAYC